MNGRPDCIIDGIEIHQPYIGELQRLIYDKIYIGDATEVIKQLGHYDFVYCGDMLEHVPKAKGTGLIQDIMAKASYAVIAVPAKFRRQQPAFGNEYERHVSIWTAQDFPGWAPLTLSNKLVFIWQPKAQQTTENGKHQ